MRRFLPAIALLCMAHAAMAAYGPASSHGVDLTGHWKLNASLSDDGEQLLQKRLEEERKRRAAWMKRAREDGDLWIPPDADESTAGEGQPLPPDRSRERTNQRRDEELRKMLGISNTLDIAQSGATIDIVSQRDSRRFEAGTRSQVSMPEGELADSQVGWDGDWFVIERKVRRGPRVVEKYRWLKKTDQLESTIAWSGDTLLSGIKIKRVFDRVVGEVAPPDPARGPVR